jgi:hypothetical protein
MTAEVNAELVALYARISVALDIMVTTQYPFILASLPIHLCKA